MSSIGRTPNYDLPRFLRGSVPQWTGDVGPAFDKIDEVLFAQGGELAGALTTVEQMKLDLQSGLERVAAAVEVANAAKEAAEVNSGEIRHVKSDIDMLSTWKSNTENRLNNDIVPPIQLNSRHIDNLHDWLQMGNMYKEVAYQLSGITIPAHTAAFINVTMNEPIPGFYRLIPNAVWGTDNRVALSGYTWSNNTSIFRYNYNNTSQVQITGFVAHISMILVNNGLVWAEDLNPTELLINDDVIPRFSVYDDAGHIIQEGVGTYEIIEYK